MRRLARQSQRIGQLEWPTFCLRDDAQHTTHEGKRLQGRGHTAHEARGHTTDSAYHWRTTHANQKLCRVLK